METAIAWWAETDAARAAIGQVLLLLYLVTFCAWAILFAATVVARTGRYLRHRLIVRRRLRAIHDGAYRERLEAPRVL